MSHEDPVSQEEPGGPRRGKDQKEPGGAKRSQEHPVSQEEQVGPMGNQEGPERPMHRKMMLWL